MLIIITIVGLMWYGVGFFVGCPNGRHSKQENVRDDKRTDGDVGTNNTVRKVRTTVVRAEFPVGIFLVFKNHRSRLLLLRT